LREERENQRQNKPFDRSHVSNQKPDRPITSECLIDHIRNDDRSHTQKEDIRKMKGRQNAAARAFSAQQPPPPSPTPSPPPPCACRRPSAACSPPPRRQNQRHHR